MSLPNIPLLCLALGLSAPPVQAQLADAPLLQISLRSEENCGDWQVQRVYLTQGTNRLAFVVPAGFHVDASDPRKIVLSDVDCTCFIGFRFISAEPAETKTLDADTYRALALGKFSGAMVAEEFAAYACDHSGLGFDLKWINCGVEQSARVIFVPSAAGVMEFSVMSSSARYPDSQGRLTTLLASLRSNERGPLKILPIPDKN